jgi:hypothetical protein
MIDVSAPLIGRTGTSIRVRLIHVHYARRLTIPNRPDNPDDRPGVRVRQQTLDVVALILASAGRADYVLFTEDDAELCAGALPLVRQSIDDGNRVSSGSWSVIRFSIGFIGILIKDASLSGFSRFLQKFYLIKPPDLLLMEWMVSSLFHVN